VGKFDEAVTQLKIVVRQKSDNADTHNNLGVALMRTGLNREARDQYLRALDLNPNYSGALNNLAWMLATCPDPSIRNGPAAVIVAQKANQVSDGENLVIVRTLAAAYAENRQFTEAIKTAAQALRMAADKNDEAWFNALQSEIKLYQTGQPYREG